MVDECMNEPNNCSLYLQPLQCALHQKLESVSQLLNLGFDLVTCFNQRNRVTKMVRHF
jgi:hypothetical protein